jgi:enoyl-CoA hydratase/carnithine racemase
MTDTPAPAVTIARQDGVAVVTLKRGDRLNALSRAVLCQLKDAALALRSDISVHAVVLTGDPIFTAGADLKDPATRDRDIEGIEHHVSEDTLSALTVVADLLETSPSIMSSYRRGRRK